MLLVLFGIFISVHVCHANPRRIPWRKDKTGNIAARFTSKSCTLCEKNYPTWKELESLHNHTTKFYEIDCDVQERVCSYMNISSYPSIQIRTFGDWSSYLFPLQKLNATLTSLPMECKYPDKTEYCHPTTKEWIQSHDISDLESLEADFEAEEEMFHVGMADLTKNFLEKKMQIVQLRQWKLHTQSKNNEDM